MENVECLVGIGIITEIAPVEIGNRVWLDMDGDGIQDAGESGIGGVTVQLLDKDGNVIAEVKTADDGTYIFSNDPNGTDDVDNGYKYNIEELVAEGEYTIRIPDISGANKQSALSNYVLTKSNTDSGENSDIRDSDGVAKDDNADAPVTPEDIPQSGANNHTFDFGFTPSVSLGSVIWFDENENGIQDDTEAGIKGLKVTLLDESGNEVEGVDPVVTDSSGTYYFNNLPAGTYRVKVESNTTNLEEYSVIESLQNTNADDNNATDFNIASGDASSGYISAPITLKAGDEPFGNKESSNLPNNGDNKDGEDDSLTDKSGNMTLDLGFSPKKATLGDYVWIDKNQDGIQDDDEEPISGVKVYLLDEDGNRIKDENGNDISTETNSTGEYLFEDLKAGKYAVEFEVPDGYVITTQDSGSDDAKDSDVNATTKKSQVVELKAGDDYRDLDMGIYKPKVSLGSVVWADLNNNGIQEADEKGIAGAVVTLLNEDGTVYDSNPKTTEVEPLSVTTDDSGTYIFKDLPEGKYSVQVDMSKVDGVYAPSTTQNANADDNNATDSNIANANEDKKIYTSGVVELTNNGEPEDDKEVSQLPNNGDEADNSDDNNGNMTVDFGFYPVASIGDTVWYDDNHNGIQDDNESGVEGVSVTLLDKDGKEIATTKTDKNGKYIFEDLEPNDYKIKFDLTTLPEGYIVTKKDSTDDNNDSDANDTTGLTELTELEAGERDLSWDMGIYKPKVSLGSVVWADLNNNGIQEADEKGIAGAVVTLLNEDGTVYDSNPKTTEVEPLSVTTDDSGVYFFDNLEEGKYKVQVDMSKVDGYKPSTTQNANADDNNATDSNIANANEDKKIYTSGVVELTNNGEPEDDKEVSQLPNNGDDSDDSDDNNGNMTVDFGFYPVATLGDYVWIDSNNNGIQDDNEQPVEGVSVYLLDGNGERIKDADGNDIKTETNATGEYLFTNLEPRDYAVEFDLTTLPKGYIVTKANAGDDNATNSDANETTGKTALVTLEAGDDYRDLDMGIYQPKATIGDTVWYDDNNNGIQDKDEKGVENVKVILLDSKGNIVSTTKTDSNGKYLFTNLVPNDYKVKFDLTTIPNGYSVTKQDSTDDKKDSDANPTTGETKLTTLSAGEKDLTWDMGIYKPEIPKSTIGDYVWLDTNKDGIQDDNESGVANVEVILLDKDGNQIAKTTTDENGKYLFTNLNPDDYQVEFNISSLPDGYVVTASNQGDDDKKDSDANPQSGKTELTTLKAGENDLSWDMGIYELIVKNDEKKAQAGTVVLINVIDNDESKNLVPSTVKLLDEEGNQVDKLVVKGEGVWEVVDDNGTVQFTPEDGFVDNPTPVEYVVQDTQGNITKPAKVVVIYENELIKIGDYIWFDDNLNGIQDNEEKGVANLTVILYDADGKEIARTKTDKSGQYLFTDLKPNVDYTLKFETPEGYHVTLQNKGKNDAKDSDVNKDGELKVHPTDDNLTYDMGIYCDCNDYTVNPKEYHKVSGSAFNIAGALVAILAILFVATRKEEM